MVVIELEHVRKAYRRQHGRSRLGDVIPQLLGQVIGGNGRNNENLLWALDDVSFEVSKGETLGLIGPNGAGKTTMLKLISRLTRPTSGRIAVHGKISALIELGAGFHPDLTGRENIYLNGSILGLKRKEIDNLFDSIVEFAELASFIDMPIKHYSSGMYVRLGFAVAVHTNPDILLVDEVLAVGDQSFRTKCYRKFSELKDSGVPVVIVSHNLTQIANLCDRAILLAGGRVKEIGDPAQVISAYYDHIVRGEEAGEALSDGKALSRKKRPCVEIADVMFLNGDNEPANFFRTGECLKIRIEYLAHEEVFKPAFGIAIFGADGTLFTGTNTKLSDYPIDVVSGQGIIDFVMPALELLPGLYQVSVIIHDQHMGSYDRRDKVYKLSVLADKIAGGQFYPTHFWQMGGNSELHVVSAIAGGDVS